MNPSLLEKFRERHIMIIGDVMLDRYMYGSVNRISPEAPVPVLDFERTEHRLGGAANVALNILAMGGRAHLIGMTGNDEEGVLFRNLLRETTISDRWLIGSDNRSTTLKTRVMARDQHLLRVDREDRSSPDAATRDRVIHTIREAIESEQPEGIILQDYNKGMLSGSIIEMTISLARDTGIPVFVDPKFRHIDSYAGCSVFKPNLQEATYIIGHDIVIDETGLEQAATELQEIVEHELTMITLSDKGLYVKRRDQPGIYVPSIPQEISDVCGAGDTVISALTMCYLSGGNDESIAKMSNIAGHIACRYPGVIPVSLEQLNKELKF